MTEDSISEEAAPATVLRSTIHRIPGHAEQVEGRINGWRVVQAAYVGAVGDPDGRWSVYVTGLPGDDFVVSHHGSGIELIVTRLTDLIAATLGKETNQR